MHRPAVSTRLSQSETAEVERLLAEATVANGYRPVSDQFWADLVHPGLRHFIASSFADSSGGLIAYAQATSPEGALWTCELVVAPTARYQFDVLVPELLRATEDEVRRADGTTLTWLVQGPTAHHDAAAEAAGMALSRQLHQMRRPLPTDVPFELETRSFDPDRDIAEWVLVNSRAFAWNPEQGSWNADSVRARMQEPWFDTEGFLVHERDGRMAGFCWTKVHDGHEPTLGEIYVIAVDPDFHGLGLGRDLTLAGLDHLAGRGIGTGMLFVDADNVAAIRVYDRLGFVIHRTDTMFRGVIS